MTKYEVQKQFVLDWYSTHLEDWFLCSNSSDFHAAFITEFGGQFIYRGLAEFRSPKAMRVLNRMAKEGILEKSVSANGEGWKSSLGSWSYIYILKRNGK